MSYILDALNKSEKDRASNKTPGMRGTHADTTQRSMSLQQILAVLVILIVINSLGVYWYFGDSAPVHDNGAQQDANAGKVLPPGSINATPVPVQNIAQTLPSAPTNADQTTTDPHSLVKAPSLPSPPLTENAPLLEQPTLITPKTATKSTAEHIDAGPPNVDITAHIYADDAAFRMVKIDGIARYEGDTLAGGYRVLHITEFGVVLARGSKQYELNVVEDWQIVPDESR